MRKLLQGSIIILLIALACYTAYAQQEVSPPPEAAGLTQGASGTASGEVPKAHEDDRLPIYKEGWQFFLAPYLWVAGIHADISYQGKFSGSVVADVPWYNLIPLLFSKAIGGMGRVEIWKGRWGLTSDTNFIYIGDSISAGGARELKLNLRKMPVAIPIRL
jgi:hypothetical protein